MVIDVDNLSQEHIQDRVKWLEANVGPQGRTWDWQISMVHPEVRDMLIIEFRRPEDATAFALRWL